MIMLKKNCFVITSKYYVKNIFPKTLGNIIQENKCLPLK